MPIQFKQNAAQVRGATTRLSQVGGRRKEQLSGIPRHDARKFTWEKTSRGEHTGHGSTEASDLGNGWKGQVWSDANDVGFLVVSPKTGRIVLFTLARTEESGGEVVSWTFVSYGRIPEHGGPMAITVFND